MLCRPSRESTWFQHIQPLLPSCLPLPEKCVSAPVSPAGIIYHYIQQTETPQLLCPGDACSHAAIKAKRHPLPLAPMGAQQQREKRRKRGTVWGGTALGREEKRESGVWNLWDRVESMMERVVREAEERHWQQMLSLPPTLPPPSHMGSLGNDGDGKKKASRTQRENRWRQRKT